MYMFYIDTDIQIIKKVGMRKKYQIPNSSIMMVVVHKKVDQWWQNPELIMSKKNIKMGYLR